MKKHVLVALMLVSLLVTLGGCYWGYPGGGRGGRGDGDRDRGDRYEHQHDRDGGRYDRR